MSEQAIGEQLHTSLRRDVGEGAIDSLGRVGALDGLGRYTNFVSHSAWSDHWTPWVHSRKN